MPTYFDNLQRNYTDITIAEDVFNVVQNDINGNIEKIRKCYDADPTKSHTLEKLVIDEQGEKKRPATDPTHKFHITL
ncbi:hypothetical protein C1646_750337 [Rhizophagus diaphanus]|nr:hypothetical protein C1646_750337 [Rhizophagus diaphanus] [Rhizophagus sp. MUCL 43196]